MVKAKYDTINFKIVYAKDADSELKEINHLPDWNARQTNFFNIIDAYRTNIISFLARIRNFGHFLKQVVSSPHMNHFSAASVFLALSFRNLLLIFISSSSLVHQMSTNKIVKILP